MIYDRNSKIDRAVRDLLVSIKDDDYLAKACADRLVGRGYDADIERYFKDRLNGHWTKEPLARLGWAPVHVAVSRGNAEDLKETRGHKEARQLHGIARVFHIYRQRL